MREIRYLDKLIDELAKGKAMEKISAEHRAQRRRREASPEQREEMPKAGRRVGEAEPVRRHKNLLRDGHQAANNPTASGLS